MGGGRPGVGIAFYSTIVITAWIACIMYLPICTIFLAILPNRLGSSIYNKLTSILSKQWFLLASGFLEHQTQTTFKFYAKPSRSNTALFNKQMMEESSCFVISNHRTRIDWMYMWSFFARTNSLGTLRIFLKDVLGKVPALGWAMQHLKFIFLKRQWESDKHYLSTALSALNHSTFPSSYLLFPEGTDLSESNLRKNASYAAKVGKRTDLQYTLHPRSTGFCHIFPQVQHFVPTLYDITMFYTDFTAGERPCEKSLAFGRFPKSVAFYIDAYDSTSLPTTEEGLKSWLESRFEKKEKLLSSLYKKKADDNNIDEYQEIWTDKHSIDLRPTVIFWTLLVMVFVLLLWIYPRIMVYYVTLVSIVYTSVATFNTSLGLWIFKNMK